MRPSRRVLQVGGDRLVQTCRRLRAVPGPPVGIQVGVDRLGQCAVRHAAVGLGCCSVERRPHQGVPKSHARTDLDEACDLGRHDRACGDAEALGRPPEQRHVTNRFGRRDQQQLLGLQRKRLHASQKALLDATRQRSWGRDTEPARERGRCHAVRQLQQRKRIPACLGDDPVTDPLIQAPPNFGRQQYARVAVCQTHHIKLRQAGEFVVSAALADREEHGDAFRLQAPRHERQHLARGPIQPLGIIDQAHVRPFLGRRRQQAQHGKRHQEVIRGAAIH
jgi:hypothetical protein